MNDDSSGLGGPELVRLTRKRRNGAVLVRSPAVDGEIRSILELPAVEIRRRASIQSQGAPDFVSAECLVYLLRDARHRNDEGMLFALWDALSARVSPFVESKLRTLADSYHEEGVAAVIRTMGITILDLDSDRGDFLQVSFWTTIQRRTIDEFRRQLRLSKEDRQFTSLDARPGKEGQSSELDGDGHGVEVEDWVSGSDTALEEDDEEEELYVEKVIRMEMFLSTLPERMRKAFILHVEGWPVESKDKNETTISSTLERTPRQIRNYLKEAKVRLSKWREESK